MEKKPQYKVIVSERARQMLAGHVLFMEQKNPFSQVLRGGFFRLLENFWKVV